MLSNTDINEVPPDPGLILESLRSIGYSFENAIADIIDNSITAGAKVINFDTVESGEYIMISDDGCGMTIDKLREAMTLGLHEAVTNRLETDLGRFGLGLKLASFSYCKKLTVASKTRDSPVSMLQWDLDHVKMTHKWLLLQPSLSDYPNIKAKMDSIEHGTVVYWEDIDRFAKNGKCLITDKEKHWYGNQIIKVNKHLGMVFHRFLEDGDFMLLLPDGSKAEPWDPFLSNHPAVKPLPSELSIKNIEIYPYVMPHKSKFKIKDAYDDGAGPNKTWTMAQGFYVYRGKRMITAASWLGLKGFTKSHDTDLARIRLDISSADDTKWMLDVKKSTVKIPLEYYSELNKIAADTRESARKVRLFRGKINRRENPGTCTFLWSMDKNRKDEVRYKLNREHPIIQKMLTSGIKPGPDVAQILQLIEETVPTQGIILEEMRNPDSVPEQFSDVDDKAIRALLKATIKFLKLEKLPKEELREHILSMEPFSDFKSTVDKMLAGELDYD